MSGHRRVKNIDYDDADDYDDYEEEDAELESGPVAEEDVSEEDRGASAHRLHIPSRL